MKDAHARMGSLYVDLWTLHCILYNHETVSVPVCHSTNDMEIHVVHVF